MVKSSWLLKPLGRMVARARLPKLSGQITLAGLHQPVEVRRDAWGVPHISAENLPDLFFAQGFVHAQDRLFQMDFNRRLAAGRLSEILGPASLQLDRWMRTLTIRRVAEAEVALLNQEGHAFFQAYANGVNAFMAAGRMPVECALLRYRPQPWVIADSLAWVKMMAWSLSVNWEAELLRQQLLENLGPEAAAELENQDLPRWPFVVPPGSDYGVDGPAALQRAQRARPFTGPSPYEGLGSNNWVISGERSVTGKPLLANDMHLGLSAPAIWYENHLSAAEIDVTGVIFPGLPGVIAGHNQYVAWGFTNGFPDVQDLYIEHLRRTPTGGVEMEVNGRWLPGITLKEVIHVKGRPDAVEEVVITRHGPIINNLAPDAAGEQPLALRWTALEPDTMAQGVFALLRARSVSEFHQALETWTCPTQNVVYADVQGHIAYTFPGKLPLRAGGHGRLPAPGWTEEYEWLGYFLYDSLPHQIDPPQGYIASANNRAFADDYPLPIELEPISGDRAQRISEMILDPSLRNGSEKIDLAFMQRMQFDLLSPSARVMARLVGQLPLDYKVQNPETEIHAAVRMLKEWDGQLNADSAAAALYQAFIRRLAWRMMGQHLGDDNRLVRRSKDQPGPRSPTLLERLMGAGPTPVLAEKSWYGEIWLPWVLNHLPNHPQRDDLIRSALRDALAVLTKRLGKDRRQWAWGRLHRLVFRHALASSPLMAAIFNRGPFPLGGDHTTVWATGGSYYKLSDDQVVGPPYRMLIDLSDWDASLSLLAPGQSGNPASHHYDDQVSAWFKAGYHPMLFSRQSVHKHTRHLLTLKPRP